MLQPRLNPASCHFSCVQIEIELSSVRTEADFQAWRDQQEWTARKYAMWQAGEKLPSQKPSTLMKCVCVQQFDSHRIEDIVIHVPHITARGGYEIHR
jgi:hypothetical protein